MPPLRQSVGVLRRKKPAGESNGTETPRSFPEAMLAEARAYPGGCVYEIAPGYDPLGAVPPEAIVGAWRVGDDGVPTGEFEANPNYRPGT
jgi:hypothetical protein